MSYVWTEYLGEISAMAKPCMGFPRMEQGISDYNDDDNGDDDSSSESRIK